MNRTTRVALAAAALALSAGAAQACTLVTMASLPVSLVDQRTVVAGRLGGGRARLLVSGAYDFSLLKPEAVSRLGLRQGTAPVSELTPDRAYVPAILEAGGSTYAVGFTLAAGERLGDLDGALGANALNGYDTEYDVGGGAVRVIRSRACYNRELAYWNKDKPYSVLPMRREAAARPRDLVGVSLNGVPATALIDAATPRSVITREAATRANLSVDDDGGRAFAVVPDIRLDQEEVRSTRMGVIDRPSTDYDLVLGADFLASHRVYIARGQQKVYITYNGGPVFAAAEMAQR